MNCGQIGRLVCDYIGDCLPEALRREVEAHLEECPACRREVQRAEEMVSCLNSLSCHQAPVDCWPGVRDMITKWESRRSGWFAWVARPVMAAPALAAAVLLAVILLWPSTVREQPRAPEAIPGYSHYVTAHSRAQQRQAFTDPDLVFIAAELESAAGRSYPNHR